MHNKYIIIPAVALATALSALGSSPIKEDERAAMISTMRQAVAKIAEEHGGDRPFGFIFTNDPQIGAIISRNVSVIEQSIPIERLIHQQTEMLRNISVEVEAVQQERNKAIAELAQAQEQLSQAQRSVELRKVELVALETRIAPMRSLVETFDSILQDFDQSRRAAPPAVLPEGRSSSGPVAAEPRTPPMPQRRHVPPPTGGSPRPVDIVEFGESSPNARLRFPDEPPRNPSDSEERPVVLNAETIRRDERR